ncbi:MAG: Na/Pi symporter [Polyangiales bacterium]
MFLSIATLSVVGYALYEEIQSPTRSPLVVPPETFDPDLDGEPDRLRIVAVHPLEPAPGAAIFVRVAGLDRTSGELYAELAKLPAHVLRRAGDRLVVRVPNDLPHGKVKLRVQQGERRSKAWAMVVKPLPRHTMVRNVFGGLALFVLGLRTVGRALRAYAGRGVRSVLSLATGDPVRAASLGIVTGIATQATTAAAALFAGLLGARMLSPGTANLLLIGAQLGAAISAVLLPLFATRDALWVIVIGALWVMMARSRWKRALGTAVIGAGMIFHGLSLFHEGCAPLLADPQVVPYLWHLQSGGLKGVLACAAAGALVSALLQGPSPVFALVLSLLQEDMLRVNDGLAVLAGVSLGALINTGAAVWAFGGDARRLLRLELVVAPFMTLIALLGLPLWQDIAAGAAQDLAWLSAEQVGLGAGYLAMALCSTACAFALLPLGSRFRAQRARRHSLRPLRPSEALYGQKLLHALTFCRQGLRGMREIIASSDRASAPSTEQAIEQARHALHELLRMTGGQASTTQASAFRAAGVAALHLTDGLMSMLRVAEKAPELGYTPSGEVASALERLHGLLDGALTALCDELEQRHFPNLVEFQAREIEINAAEAEIRRGLFAGQTSGDELALRLWSSELCSAYESIGNQVYRAVTAVAAEDDL